MGVKYPQIHTGQIWLVPDTGETVTIDEVYATDAYNSNEWRAMVRYTISGALEPDLTTATEFGKWIRKHGFTLIEQRTVEVSA